MVGATAHLVRVKTVAIELGLTHGACTQLLKKLGVTIRRMSRHDYVMLFALERALWRWFGLSDDLAVFEMAWRAYRDMQRRGLEKHLKRLGLGQIRNNLKERAILWENLTKLVKTQNLVARRTGRPTKSGRPLKGQRWVAEEVKKAGMVPLLGPTLQADPAIKLAGANGDNDLPAENPGSIIFPRR